MEKFREQLTANNHNRAANSGNGPVPLPKPAHLSPSDFDREKGIYPPFIDIIGDGKTPYKEGTKTCAKCKKATSSPKTLFWKSLHWSSKPPISDGFCNICKECLVETLEITAAGLRNFDSSDWQILMEALNLPLNLKKIEKMYEREEIWEEEDPIVVLDTYFTPEKRGALRANSPAYVREPSNQDASSLVDELFAPEEYQRLLRKWGRQSPSDLLQLESMWKEMEETYEIKTPSQRDYIEKICKVSLQLDRFLENGDLDGVTKLSRTYDALMKSAKLTEAQRNDNNTISSIAELSAIIESKGFIPQWNSFENEKQDLVDRTISDMQSYTERLIRECVDIDALFKNYAGSVLEADDVKLSTIEIDDSDDVINLEGDILREVEALLINDGVEVNGGN